MGTPFPWRGEQPEWPPTGDRADQSRFPQGRPSARLAEKLPEKIEVGHRLVEKRTNQPSRESARGQEGSPVRLTDGASRSLPPPAEITTTPRTSPMRAAGEAESGGSETRCGLATLAPTGQDQPVRPRPLSWAICSGNERGMNVYPQHKSADQPNDTDPKASE